LIDWIHSWKTNVRNIFNKILPGNKKNEEASADDGVEEAAGPTTPLSPVEASMEPPTGVESESVDDPDDAGDAGKTMPLPPLSPVEPSQFDTMISPKGAAGQSDPIMRVGQRCHVGALRSRNEDSCLTFVSETGGQEPLLPFGLFVVADGMGGHHAGHEASRTVSRLVAHHVLDSIYLPLLQDPAAGSREPIHEVMLRAVQTANMSIFSPDPEKESGTTVTAALILGRRLYLVHVGDSRAYLYSEEKLEQVTTDHSYVRRLQEAGQLTPEEAASHPQRNVLYRAVGQGDELEIDTFTRSLPKAGKLILCSDGLWGLVPEPMMQEVLDRDISPQEKVDILVNMALQAGGHDNITGVLVDFVL
jgi:serine/threonine protein phosphatase PrpC